MRRRQQAIEINYQSKIQISKRKTFKQQRKIQKQILGSLQVMENFDQVTLKLINEILRIVRKSLALLFLEEDL